MGLDWLPRLYGNFVTLGIGIGVGLWLIYARVKRAIAKSSPPRKRGDQSEKNRPIGITIIASLYIIIGGGTFLPAIWLFLFFPFTPGMGNVLLSTLAVVGGVGILFLKEWGWWTGTSYVFLMIGLYIVTFLRNLSFRMWHYTLLLFNRELPIPDLMLYSVLIFIGHVLLAVYFFRGPLTEYCQVHSPKPFKRLMIIAVGALGLSALCNLRPFAQSPDWLLKMLVKFLVGG